MNKSLDEREVQIALGLPISLGALRLANELRHAEWHAGATREWVAPDWGNELAGEVGELCNVVKKFQRVLDGIKSGKDTLSSLREKIGEEAADVIICVSLLLNHVNRTLAEHNLEELVLEHEIVYKFNATSEKHGLETKL